MLTTRTQLVTAAFELFEAVGYDATTVEDITARAGVGRTTFFRTFRSKDEVVFPDHTRILAGMEERLTAPLPDPAVAAREAALFVIQQFLDEGPLAASRYRLTSTVPALRDRELAMMSAYQRRLGQHFRSTGVPALEADLLGSVWVTVHNHVLRSWLRGRTKTPVEDLTQALDDAYSRLSRPPAEEASVVVFRTGRPLAALLPGLEVLLGERVG